MTEEYTKGMDAIIGKLSVLAELADDAEVYPGDIRLLARAILDLMRPDMTASIDDE